MKSRPLYKFYRHKYGSELFVDVIDIDAMKADISRPSIYCTSFYSIFLSSSFLHLTQDLFGRLVCLYKNMKPEIDSNCSDKDRHFPLRYISAFQKQVNEDFLVHCDVKYDASLLYITPNYQNKIVTQHLRNTSL